MRRGEILCLKKGDIDWHNLQIAVRRTFSKGEFGSPKTKAGYRKIDMSPYLAHELKKHILRSPVSELDLVFPSAVRMGSPSTRTT
jgi:integrase